METIDLFALLTAQPSKPVKSVHSKAMQLDLMTAEEHEIWMDAPWSEMEALQLALQDGALEIS